jgi:hypothetical protein
MARIIHLACARCGHPEMFVVASAESDEAVKEIEHVAGDRATVAAADDTATFASVRLRRLESLPTSLPVGGIITPV